MLARLILSAAALLVASLAAPAAQAADPVPNVRLYTLDCGRATAADMGFLSDTGEYDGNRDVYVIPSTGGEPRRLTWHPDSDDVVGWTPDGSGVIFRSRREIPLGGPELPRRDRRR